MYKVQFRKQVHGCAAGASSLDEFLKKDVELPFAPSVGINYRVGDLEIYPKEVWWNQQENAFRVYTESNREIYDAELKRRPHRPIEEIVAEYVEMGWEVMR